MSINTNVPDTEEEICRNGTFWEWLYGFLRTLVSYWVYSAHLSLWHGQEEEITADIVQEAISDTFKYTQDYLCRTREKNFVLWKPLQRVSAVLAYKHYERQRRRDYSFVAVRVYNIAAQGYVLFRWRDDPLEITLQERYCEYLAGAILKIPSRPRTALLVHLANHTRLKARTTLLRCALSKRGIHLQKYEGSLPDYPQKQREHQALLQIACMQLIQEHNNPHQEPLAEDTESALLAELEMEQAEHNLEFLGLMTRLEMTAPFPHPDLTFRENLRNTLHERFLNIQIEYQQKDEGDLASLEACLDAKAPPALMDPLNREALLEALREKLKDIKATLPAAPRAEDVIKKTEENLETTNLPSFVTGD
jgi:hypothetical protein